MLAVYQAGIDQGDATFETAAPSWEDFTASKLPGHRHVAIGGSGEVAGWVAASPVSDRCVYAGVVEHSVYVHPAARGQGAGRLLLAALIASTEAAGIWRGSVALVDRHGRETGTVMSSRSSSVFAGFRFPREVREVIVVAVRWYLR